MLTHTSYQQVVVLQKVPNQHQINTTNERIQEKKNDNARINITKRSISAINKYVK